MAPTPILLSPSRARASGITLGKDESAFRENSATIVMPSAEAAFLNPVQEFNRDLSIMAIRTWSERLDHEKKLRFLEARKAKEARLKRKFDNIAQAKAKKQKLDADPTVAATEANGEATEPPADGQGSSSTAAAPEQDKLTLAEERYTPYKFTLLEALAATGLRSIRYAKEIPLLRWVIANDLSPTAVEAMKRNVALNFPPDRPIDEWIASEATKELESGEEAEDKTETLDEDALTELENEAKAAAAAAESAAAAAPSSKTNAIHPDCKIKLNAGDAITLMYNHRDPTKRFDVVDLDPYGSAAPFLDGGVQSVSDGGLLCVTCTDLAVLAGHNYPEKAYSQYGGVSVKSEFSHEVALRLVLHSIATSAARYGRYIQPLLSLSIDFYMRTFVRVWTGPVEVKNNAARTGTVYVCTACQDWAVQRMGRSIRTESVGKTGETHVNHKYRAAQGPPVPASGSGGCASCGGQMHLGGPMWFGPLHDAAFCRSLLSTLDRDPSAVNTSARIRGMVSLAASELPDAPFYFTPAKISGLFHCVSPPLDKMVSALLSGGYDVSRSHASAGSLKTSASRAQVYDIMRDWVRANPVRMDKLKPNDPAHALLAHEPSRSYNFDNTSDPQVQAVLGDKMVRYQTNPQANWGPGTAAKGHKGKKRRNVRPDDFDTES